MISTNQFRAGMTIRFEGDIYRIVDFQHVKPGKGGAFVRTKLRNVATGAIVDRTFRPEQKFDQVRTESRTMTYLYDEPDQVVFMDGETYEQLALPKCAAGRPLRSHEGQHGGRGPLHGRQPYRRRAATVRRSRGDRDGPRRPRRYGERRQQVGHARDRAPRSRCRCSSNRATSSASTRAPGSTTPGSEPAPIPSPRQKDRPMKARRIAITDTTLRDAHQSLWATRMRIGHIVPDPAHDGSRRLPLAGVLGRGNLRHLPALSGRGSLGAPAHHQASLSGARRSRCCLRGQNLVGYRHYGDEIVRAFVRHAADSGVDIFRVFDALNDTRNIRTAAEAIKETRQALPGRRRVHHQPGAHARPLRGGGAGTGGDGRGQHLHQGHGGPALALLRRAAGHAPQAGDRPAAPAALPLHRRPGSHDLPQGHRGRGGRGRYGHGAAGLRRQPAGHRDAGDRSQGHPVRHRARSGSAVRDRRVLREGPRGGRVRTGRHLADPHAGLLAPGAGRHDLEPDLPAEGAEGRGTPGRGAGGDPQVSGPRWAIRRW